jgi:hypothetical protein
MRREVLVAQWKVEEETENGKAKMVNETKQNFI